MNIPNINKSNIAEYFNTEEVIKETIAQILKDFALFGIILSFSGKIKSAYNEVFEQLVFQISSLLENDDKVLLSILYQVDISEKDLIKTRLEYPNSNQIEIIAHQIIARDLKKVLTRKYFKNLS